MNCSTQSEKIDAAWKKIDERIAKACGVGMAMICRSEDPVFQYREEISSTSAQVTEGATYFW